MKSFVLTVVILSQLPLSGATMIFPEKRRTAVLENFEMLVTYSIPQPEELRLIPDPFVFGREIEVDKPPSLLEGISDEQLLARFGDQIRASIIGLQRSGDQSFLATRDFGLLRAGDTLTMPLPGDGEGTAEIIIVKFTQTDLTLGMDGLDIETTVPLDSNPAGITTSSP